MQPMPHQLMGYDRAITMFSPDGRLLQVEYAKKTVRQGSTTIAMVCKDGIVFVADKRIVDKLIVAATIEKVWKLDDHMGIAASGIISDARVLVERAQLKAQQHRVTFDGPIDVITVVKDIASLKQICTQSGGLRPFGVSTRVGGVDITGPRLFETDPTGIFFEYKATVIGEGEPEIEELLDKEYKESLSMEDGLRLAIKGLMLALDKKFGPERLEAAFVPTATKKFAKVSKSVLDRAIKDVKKK